MLYRVFGIKDEAEMVKSLEIFQQRHGCPPAAMWVHPDTKVSAAPSPSIPVVFNARMAAGFVYFEVPGQRQPEGQLALPWAEAERTQ